MALNASRQDKQRSTEQLLVRRDNLGSFGGPLDQFDDPDSGVSEIEASGSALTSVRLPAPNSDDGEIVSQQSPDRQSLASRPLPPLPVGADMAANSSNAFPPLENSMNSPRSPASGPGSQVNGNGASYANNYIPPLPVGHQQDLTFLYQQIQELSGILQSNRERVNEVTQSAEEVAVNRTLV